MAKQLPLTIDGWLQWLDAVNMQAEAFLEDNNAIHARSILRDGLGQFRQCHPKAPSLLQPGVVRSLNNLARTYELLHNPPKALKCLEKARAFIAASSMISHSAEVDTHANLAAVFTKLGRLSEAIEHCKIAIRLLQPLLLDDDIDATLQARARMFLIVSYNLAVAQSRLKLFEEAITISGRHLKMVHAILPLDDAIRRKLIDFRRHLVECMQQQRDEVSSEADDPFCGTFVDVSSNMQRLQAVPPEKPDVHHSSDADADSESNVIFPAQHHRTGSGKTDAVTAQSYVPAAMKDAWGDARRQTNGRNAASSLKENEHAHPNIATHTIFNRKMSSSRSREHEMLIALHEDLPSSLSASAASSDRTNKQRSDSHLDQLHHVEQVAEREPSAHQSGDLGGTAALAPETPRSSMLHMRANDSRAAVLNLQVPPASLLQISKTSAIITLQRFCRCVCCRPALPHARIENSRVLLSIVLLRMHLQKRLARSIARCQLSSFLLRCNRVRAMAALLTRVGAMQQLGSVLLRHCLLRRLLTAKRACACVIRVYRGHLSRLQHDVAGQGAAIVIQRRWRCRRSLQRVDLLARQQRHFAALHIEFAAMRLQDVHAAMSVVHVYSARCRISSANILICNYKAFVSRRQLESLRSDRNTFIHDANLRRAIASAQRIVVACRMRFSRCCASASVVCRTWRRVCSRRIFSVLRAEKLRKNTTDTLLGFCRFWLAKRVHAAAVSTTHNLIANASSVRISCAWFSHLDRIRVSTLRAILLASRFRLQASRLICSVCQMQFHRDKYLTRLHTACATKLSSACVAALYRNRHIRVLLPHLVTRLRSVMAARLIHRCYAVARCLRRSARARVQRWQFLKAYRLSMAVRVQCAQRAHVARNVLRMLLTVRHRQMKEDLVRTHVAAAAVIISAWSLYMLRARARVELKRRRSVSTITNAWLSHQIRKHSSSLVVLVLRRASARTLQRAFKCHLSRRCISHLVMQQCRAAAAKSVQMAWRRVLSVRVLRERYRHRVQSIAVVDLQCAVRARAARLRLQNSIEGKSRTLILGCLQRRFCRALYQKTTSALFLLRSIAAHSCRKTYVRDLFLMDCGHIISRTRLKWLKLQAV